MKSKAIPIPEAIRLWEMREDVVGWLIVLHAQLVIRSVESPIFSEDAREVYKFRNKIQSLDPDLGKKDGEQ